MRTDPETVRMQSRPLTLHRGSRHVPQDAPTAAGGTVLAVDFRAHGRTPHRWSPLEELAADARTALDAAADRAAGPMLIFGNSLAAMAGLLTTTRGDRMQG